MPIPEGLRPFRGRTPLAWMPPRSEPPWAPLQGPQRLPGWAGRGALRRAGKTISSATTSASGNRGHLQGNIGR